MEKLELDYYYGKEAEQFTFYRLPKVLITDSRFKNITNNAKLLYGLMLDRMSLSRKRGWLDEENRVYIKYSEVNIAEDLNINRKTSAGLLKELEAFGLVEMIKESGKPNIIYIKNFVSEKECTEELHEEEKESDTEEAPDLLEDLSDSYTGEENSRVEVPNQSVEVSCAPYDHVTIFDRGNAGSETCPNMSQVPGNISPTNNKQFNNTLSYNNPIHLSVAVPETKEIDGMDEVQAYMELIKQNIDYDVLMSDKNWRDRDLYDELYNIICDIVCVPRDKVRIGGEDYPYQLVKSKFLKLNASHLEYVITCIQNNTTKITNIRAYLITALYNAPNTIDHYYTAEVNHDLYGVG